MGWRVCGGVEEVGKHKIVSTALQNVKNLNLNEYNNKFSQPIDFVGLKIINKPFLLFSVLKQRFPEFDSK